MPVRLLQVTALAAFFCASARAAPLQIPTNVPIVEVAQQTNTYTYTPVNENNSTIKRVVPISDALVTGQNVSDVEPKVSTTRRLPVGTGADVTAKVTIPKRNIAKALVATAKGVGKVALPGVAALALDALLDYGLKNVKLGDDGELTADGEQEDGAFVSDGRVWQYGDKPFNSKEQACAYGLSTIGPAWIVVNLKMTNIYSDVVACDYTLKIGEGYDPFTRNVNIFSPSYSNCLPGYYVWNNSCTKDKPTKAMQENEILDKIASDSGWPTSSSVALAGMLQYPDTRRILQDYPSNGVEINGPASVKGKSTTATEGVQLVPGTTTVAPPGTPPSQTQPGTKTTTTTATHPITYSGSNVSYSTVNNTTTNITNNTTNVTTTETKTEEVKDDKEPDQCQKHPNSIGCKEIDFDTPEGEIPRKKIDVSWSPVDLGLGGGSCPAPVQIYENKQFSYQLACDNLHIIKPMVIAIALFVGGMIIFGGRADQ